MYGTIKYFTEIQLNSSEIMITCCVSLVIFFTIIFSYLTFIRSRNAIETIKAFEKRIMGVTPLERLEKHIDLLQANDGPELQIKAGEIKNELYGPDLTLTNNPNNQVSLKPEVINKAINEIDQPKPLPNLDQSLLQTYIRFLVSYSLVEKGGIDWRKGPRENVKALEQIFSYSAIIGTDKRLNFRSFQSMPQIIYSLGIIITFILFLIALGHADNNNGSFAIINLIKDKIWVSIAAGLSSLLLSIVIDSRNKSFEAVREKFLQSLALYHQINYFANPPAQEVACSIDTDEVSSKVTSKIVSTYQSKTPQIFAPDILNEYIASVVNLQKNFESNISTMSNFFDDLKNMTKRVEALVQLVSKTEPKVAGEIAEEIKLIASHLERLGNINPKTNVTDENLSPKENNQTSDFNQERV